MLLGVWVWNHSYNDILVIYTFKLCSNQRLWNNVLDIRLKCLNVWPKFAQIGEQIFTFKIFALKVNVVFATHFFYLKTKPVSCWDFKILPKHPHKYFVWTSSFVYSSFILFFLFVNFFKLILNILLFMVCCFGFTRGYLCCILAIYF